MLIIPGAVFAVLSRGAEVIYQSGWAFLQIPDMHDVDTNNTSFTMI
jgi:hypothetical protein